VHKANVLKVTEALFIDECKKVAKEFPDVALDEVIVDAMMAHVVRNPERFDVIVTTNMYGDILSDLTAELSGSLGMAASLNAGANHAMAQAAHGSAPDIAGQGIANPIGQVWTGALMLDHLGHADAAEEVCAAIARVLDDPANHTPDLGGRATTAQVTAALEAAIQEA